MIVKKMVYKLLCIVYVYRRHMQYSRGAVIDESRQRLREASVDTTASYKRVPPNPGAVRKSSASDPKLIVPIGDYAATKEEKHLRNLYQGGQADLPVGGVTTHAHAGGGYPVRKSHLYELPKGPGEHGPEGTKVYFELDPDDPRQSSRRSTWYRIHSHI